MLILMNRKHLSARHDKLFPKVRIWICLLAVLLLELVPGLGQTRLSACAMSALISVNGQALDQFPREGKALDFRDYNDPWDYFGFVMANSTPAPIPMAMARWLIPWSKKN